MAGWAPVCRIRNLYRGGLGLKKLVDFPYQNILVLGLAKSGSMAAEVLLANGKNVRVNDMKAEEENVVRELAEKGAEVIVGSHPLHVLDNIELLVKNPGIPYDNPIAAEAEKRNIPIVTEIELAYHLTQAPIIGITGSNGKTTTTTLINEMLKQSGCPVKMAGNIGIAATEAAIAADDEDSLVLELSSFQLQGIEDFKPHIAALLNIYEAHLDYHKTMEAYQQAKYNIFKNQTSDDYLIYNAEDPLLREAVKKAASKSVPFSVSRKCTEGVWHDNEMIYFREEAIITLKDIVLVGSHNLENILAAVACAKLSGATNEGIRKVLTTFTGVSHRLQYVGSVNGRRFYNDSKATNILATQKALGAFSDPTILLAGGLDRGNEFTDLLPFMTSVKAMVVFGETKEKLKRLAEEADIQIVLETDNVEEATEKAYAFSQAEDIILLSPACASWDQYHTFEERGNMFVQAVHKLM